MNSLVAGIPLLPLAYVSALARRDLASIDLVVIHCTELPDLATARAYGERIHYPETGTGNCGHFYIDRDGARQCWADIDRIAHHTRGFNERSIGIELVNRGRYPNWLDSRQQAMHEEYAPEQIQSLLQLLTSLLATCGALKYIAGHEDLDREKVPASDRPDIKVFRKRDPGPLFPWHQVLNAVRLQRSDLASVNRTEEKG